MLLLELSEKKTQRAPAEEDVSELIERRRIDESPNEHVHNQILPLKGYFPGLLLRPLRQARRPRIWDMFLWRLRQ